ncbi:MAG: TonB-dependent receptor [Candidatus Marinimicrobia bacterium]|nr:TonB-dependent receptor [Candidatus Neomarinimicrobiota bacterium]
MIFRIVFTALLMISTLLGSTISGYVFDNKSGESIVGVNVFVRELSKGSATNLDGFFIIRDIQDTHVALTFSHIAYVDTTFPVILNIERYYFPRVTLSPQAIDTKAIEVVGQRSSIINKDLDISSFQVDPIVLSEIPQLSKDVFKLVKFSPSVTISDPMSPQYYVRGSDPGENLVQLDGMTIYNPQHFMGSNAIFNPYAIKNIEMLVGGFDAEYGGRNASILNITTREGHRSEIHGEFRPSISGISGAIEFPAGERGSAMLSGRLLSDLMLKVLMGSPNLMMDYNGAYQISYGKTRLRFSGFFARDYMDYRVANLMLFFPDSVFESFEEGFIAKTNNRAVGLKVNTVLLPNLLFEGQVYHSGSRVDNQTYFGYSIADTSSGTDVRLNYKTHIENSIFDNTIKANLAWYAFGHQTLKLGFEINDLNFSNETGRVDTKPDPLRTGSQFQAVFFQDEVDLGPLMLKAGLRQSRLRSTDSWNMEPRVSMSLRVGKHVLKAAYGHYYQYLTTMDSKSEEFVRFLDYYQSLGDHAPIHSFHHILGIEGQLTKTLEYSIATYYKDLRQLYHSTYSSSIMQSSENTQIEGGSGESYGFEVLIKGSLGRLSGWVGYNYSKGYRNYPSIQNGKQSLFDGDQPHNFKSLLMYKLTPDIIASSTMQITSGYPRTWETGMRMHYSYDPLNNDFGVFATNITPERNNVRYPSRMTWDIGWKKKLRSGFGYNLAEYLGGLEAYYTMTIRNLLFLHRNPIYYIYFPGYGYYGLDVEFLPAISVGYNLRF